jgi:hypothetical protein
MNSVMDDVIDGILKVLRTISKMVGTKDFHHVNIEKLNKSCINDWHGMGHKKLDVGEFCLILIIQICCLAKVGITGHRDLNNLMYPVSSLGAESSCLAHINPSDQPYIFSLILREMQLELCGKNAAKGILCETSEDKVGKIYKHVFPKQMQFCIGSMGENL